MHVQLSKIDPIAALRIAPLDTQRVTRALEIFHTTGRSLSDWHLNAPKPTPLMAQGRWLHISIEHEGEAGKLLLWQRIENRFDTMLEQGFLDEVRRLRSNPDLHADLASIRCVGYRQAWGHLTGDYDLNQMRALGITATRQLAKRQMTWLRSMPERVVFNPFQT